MRPRLLLVLAAPETSEALDVQGVHVGLIGLAKAKEKKALASLEAQGAHVRTGCDQQTELVFCSKRLVAKLGHLSKMGIQAAATRRKSTSGSWNSSCPTGCS